MTPYRSYRCLPILAIVAWAITVAGSHAADDQNPVESAREALDGRTYYPWYDAEQDDFRRIAVEPPPDSAANRNSTWQAKPTPPTGDWSWLGDVMRLIGRILWWLAIIGLIALLVAVIVFLARAFVAREDRSMAPTEEHESEQLRTEADRIDSLPFQVRLPQQDLLSEARRCYENGDYGQAIIYLFSYKLVALDRHDLIRLTKGKTNHQYLGELTYRPALQEILQRTMLAFEDVFFGNHPLERERFESCWSRLDDFHQRIEQAAAL
jgi:hypothetical protein